MQQGFEFYLPVARDSGSGNLVFVLSRVLIRNCGGNQSLFAAVSRPNLTTGSGRQCSPALFFAAFDRLCSNDAGFRQKLLDWIVSARYGEPKLDPSGADVDANEQRYHEACRKAIRGKLRERRRWYDAHLPTLDPKLRVRSFEEASIANC